MTATVIQVYIDNGNVFQYEVEGEAKAREHMAAITETGYRSVHFKEGNVLTWYPAHRIVKVVCTLPYKSTTKYFDKVVST